VGIDCIWHNMYVHSDFITFRKQSSLSVDRVLLEVAKHVEDGLYSIISISASKHSFVVVCGTKKTMAELGDSFPFIG